MRFVPSASIFAHPKFPAYATLILHRINIIETYGV